MKFKHFALGAALTATAGTGGTVAVDQLVINPYTTNGTQLEIQASSTLPEAGTDKVSIDTTQPKVTFSKWNGEVQMGVTYTGMPGAEGGRPFLSKNVEWSQGDQKMQVVPLAPTAIQEDGGYEINILLNSKPLSNIFAFAIAGWEQLDFFYQPPLWQEAGLNAPNNKCNDTNCDLTSYPKTFRPDNVVGSYAVYFRNHRDHIEGETNYATGKAYHIFRPKVTDSNGSTTWADLNFFNGVLSVTVPLLFIDHAVYPVTIDPDFGYTTAGATGNDLQLGGSNATAPANGTITSMTVSVALSSTQTNMNMGVYNWDGTAHKISTHIAHGTAILGPAAGQEWKTINVSAAITNGTIYGLMQQHLANMTMYRDTGKASGNYLNYQSLYTFDTWGDSPATNNLDTTLVSIYATYTVAAAASTPPSDDGQWFQLFP